MPAPVQFGRFARFVQNLFGVQGHMGLQAIDDVFPIVNIHDRSEESFLGREERVFAQNFSAAAVVGAFSNMGLVNPPGSGKLVVLETVTSTSSIWIYGGVATVVTPGAALTMNSAYLDTRILPAGLTGSPASALMDVGSGPAVLDTQFCFPQFSSMRVGAVLQPGTWFRFWGGTLNTVIGAQLHWRERQFTESERYG